MEMKNRGKYSLVWLTDNPESEWVLNEILKGP